MHVVMHPRGESFIKIVAEAVIHVQEFRPPLISTCLISSTEPMTIPARDFQGLLPEGIHDSTLEECQGNAGATKGNCQDYFMKVSNADRVVQAVGEITRLYKALAHLKAETGPAGDRQFQLLAEGPLAEIRQLQEQVELSLCEPVVAPEDRLMESDSIIEKLGRIREIDLDRQTFTLRERGSLGEVACFFEMELLQAVKWLSDRDVKVLGAFVIISGGRSILKIRKVTVFKNLGKILPRKSSS